MRSFVFVLLAPCVLGCSSNAHAPASYVGAVDGTDIAVGLATQDGKIALFFCGGATSLQSTKWFRGASEPSSIALTIGGATLAGSASDNSASGTIDFGNGTKQHWTATRVSEDGVPGLYENPMDPNGSAGVVVRDSMTMQGAFIPNAQAMVEQIVPILPIARMGDSIRVTVNESAPRAITVVRTHAH